MDFKEINLSYFGGREEILKNIKRYAQYPVMFYRTNLHIHSTRLLWMLEDVASVVVGVFPDFEIERARALAIVHDDAEIVTGDIPFNKKKRMNEIEMQQHKKEEGVANDCLSSIWASGKVNGFDYNHLLEESSKKKSPESIVLSYLDKIDAWCESLHELFAGNVQFHNAIPNPPVRGSVMGEIQKAHPELQILVKYGFDRHAFFSNIPVIDKQSILSQGRPYDCESVKKTTSVTHYDMWKTITLERGGNDGLVWLIDQREF